jgi:hypothetical protein
MRDRREREKIKGRKSKKEKERRKGGREQKRSEIKWRVSEVKCEERERERGKR